MPERLMKDSKNPWIKSIPENWEIIKTKYVANLQTGNSIKDEEKHKYVDSQDARPYISSKDIDVENHKVNYSNGLYIKTDDGNFKIGKKGSSLMCIEGGSAGRKKALLKEDVSYVNKLCCFQPTNINNRYLFYTLCSPDYEDEFKRNISGMIGGVSQTVLKNILICLPPYEEQEAIANYLDEKCEKIDIAIEEAKNSIDKYKELKVAFITESILRKEKITKKTPYEWIEEINADATVFPLKYYSYLKGRIGWQGLKFDEFTNEGPYCITGTDFKDGYVNWDTCYHVSEERYQMDKNIWVKEGDLLITKDGTIGKLAIIDKLPDKACLNSHLLIIRPLKQKFTNEFLYWVLSSDIFKHYYSIVSSGTTMQSLSQEKLGNFIVPCYPLDIQNDISKKIRIGCVKYDDMIAEKENLIKDLEAYKKSLIYECVTGKKEVF